MIRLFDFFKYLMLSTVIILTFTGCASSMLDQRVSTKKARVIFLVPKKYTPQQVQKALYEAISFRADDIQEQENFFPETLPEKPDSPKQGSIFGGRFAALAQGDPNFEAMNLNTSNAFYTVTGKAKAASPVFANYAVFKGAIYPFKDGYKVYIYLFYKEGSDGIMGGLVQGIASSIVGQKDTRLLYIAQVRDEFLQHIKDAKIISEYPFTLSKIKTKSILGGLGRK